MLVEQPGQAESHESAEDQGHDPPGGGRLDRALEVLEVLHRLALEVLDDGALDLRDLILRSEGSGRVLHQRVAQLHLEDGVDGPRHDVHPLDRVGRLL